MVNFIRAEVSPLSFRIESPAPKAAWAPRKFSMDVEKVHLCRHLSQSFLCLRLNSIPLYMYDTPRFLYPLVGWSAQVVSLSWWLRITLQRPRECKHLFKTLTFKMIFIYLLIFAWAGSSSLRGLFPSCNKQGCSPGAMHGLLTATGSPASEHSLGGTQPSGAAACGRQWLRLPDSRAQFQSWWRTGLVAPQHVGSPALAGGFLTTEPSREAPQILMFDAFGYIHKDSIAGSYRISILKFLKTLHTAVSTSAVLFCILISSAQLSNFSTSLSRLVVFLSKG